MFQIQILDSSGHIVHQIPLTDQTIVIGRDPKCEVCLAENPVSRRHAVLELRGKFCFIRDLGSTNGTWVNKSPVKEQLLRPGDIVSIGSFRILVKQDATVPGDETFTEVERARFDDSAFTFDASPRSEHTVRLDTNTELARILAGRQILDRLVRLQEISQEIGLIESPEYLYNKVLKIVLAELAADRACILIQEGGGRLRPVAAFSAVDGDSRDSIDLHQGVIETVVRERAAILTEDAALDARFRGKGPTDSERVHSVMCAPLLTSKEFQGVLYVDRGRSGSAFQEEDLRIFAVLANQVAISLNNARLFQDVLNEKRRVRAIIEHLSEGLVITDSSLRIEKYNEPAARILAGTNTYLIEKNLLDLFESRSTSVERDDVMEAVENDESFQFTLGADGEKRVFAVSVSSCPGAEKSEIGHIFSFKDLSELASLGVLKSEFIRIAAHKLRTPLTVLMGNLELLREPGSPGEANVEAQSRDLMMAGVERNLGQLQALVSRFVEFVELDDISESLQEVSLDEMITMAWAGVATRAEIRGVKLDKPIPAHDAVINGLPGRVVQCFTNVLDNAIKFSPVNGTVRVRVEEEPQCFRIHFHDEGPGIPESDLPYIFSGFHQVDKPGTGEAEGVGLGLTIAKRILHIHGATIHASSPESDVSTAGGHLTVSFPKPQAQQLRTTSHLDDRMLVIL